MPWQDALRLLLAVPDCPAALPRCEARSCRAARSERAVTAFNNLRREVTFYAGVGSCALRAAAAGDIFEVRVWGVGQGLGSALGSSCW